MDFLPTVPVLGAYLAAVLVITFTPGPDMTLFLGKAVRQGTASGMAALLGASTGVLVHTTLVAIGLSALLAASATAFLILKLVGALYLLWLAVEAVQHGSAFNLDAGKPLSAREPLLKTWLQGLIVNLLNPKIIMFFVTFLPQFVAADDPFAAQKLVFLGLYFIAFSTPLAALMILGAERVIALLRDYPKVMRAIDYSFAALFGAFAVKILTTQGR